MKTIRQKIATLCLSLSAVAAVVGFSSCNNEDEVLKKNGLKTELETSYSRFEQNDYSVQQVLEKTADFCDEFRDRNMQDISIADAVVSIETLWNYGVVTKQSTQEGEEYRDRDFSFTTPLTEDGDVDGESLQGTLSEFLSNVLTAMSGNYLNMGDVSVLSINENSVSFNLKILAYHGDPVLWKWHNRFYAKVVKEYGDTISVPSTYTINPNDYTSETQIEGLAKYMLKTVPYWVVNLSTKSNYTPYDTLHMYVSDVTKISNGGLLLKSDEGSFNGDDFVFDLVTSNDIEDRIIPSYLYYAERFAGNKTLIYITPMGKTDSMYTEYIEVSKSFGYNETFYRGCIPIYRPPVCLLYLFGTYKYALLQPYEELSQQEDLVALVDSRITLPEPLVSFMN